MVFKSLDSGRFVLLQYVSEMSEITNQTKKVITSVHYLGNTYIACHKDKQKQEQKHFYLLKVSSSLFRLAITQIMWVFFPNVNKRAPYVCCILTKL